MFSIGKIKHPLELTLRDFFMIYKNAMDQIVMQYIILITKNYVENINLSRFPSVSNKIQ